MDLSDQEHKLSVVKHVKNIYILMGLFLVLELNLLF